MNGSQPWLHIKTKRQKKKKKKKTGKATYTLIPKPVIVINLLKGGIQASSIFKKLLGEF